MDNICNHSMVAFHYSNGCKFLTVELSFDAIVVLYHVLKSCSIKLLLLSYMIWDSHGYHKNHSCSTILVSGIDCFLLFCWIYKLARCRVNLCDAFAKEVWLFFAPYLMKTSEVNAHPIPWCSIHFLRWLVFIFWMFFCFFGRLDKS